MENLLHIINNVSFMRYFPNLRISSIVEILLLTIVFYYIIKSIRGTRAWVLSKGLGMLLMVYLIAYTFKLDVIVALFQNAILFLGIAIVIIVQPELRRMIERLGGKNIPLSFKIIVDTLFKGKNEENQEKIISDNVIQEIVKGCSSMSKVKTGVLIVIERDTPLTEYIESGILINADITSALLINVFEHNTPLHDGAVIVRNNKLTAATCYLPLSESNHINKDLGTRHRAGIGITEITDAVVVIVSEETGAISFAKDGKLLHNIDREQLSEELRKIQTKETIISKNSHKRKKNKDFNLPLKIACLFSAFILWVMMITTINPIQTITLRNIPVECINTNIVTETGKTYEIKGKSIVDVTITDRKTVTDKITTNDIKVIADFQKLSYVNSIPLEYKFNGTSDVRLSESTLLVSLEDVITSEVNVDIRRVGEPNDLYYISEMKLDYETIVISGAESVINTIGVVTVEIDESVLTKDTILKVKPIVYDKNGEIIDESKLNLNRNELQVTIHMYKTKRVPLNLNLIVVNPVLSKMITNMEYDNKNIMITGPDEVLEKYSELNLDIPITIELSDIVQTQYIRNIQLQNYVSDELIIPTQYNRMNIGITFKEFYTKLLNIHSSNISIDNLDDGLEAKIYADVNNFNIVGFNPGVEDKTITDVKPFVNLNGYTEGEHKVTIELKDTTVDSYDTITASVIITKKAEE